MSNVDLTPCKAIFFDAGGTLFQPYPSVGEIYAEVAGRFGLQVGAKEIEKAFHDEWEGRDGICRDGATSSLQTSTHEREKEWWRSLVGEVFSRFGEIEKSDAFFEELYERFAGPESWRLFPEVIEVLQTLKSQGKVLGVISNWDSRLFGICEGLGLGSYLDFVLASAVVGAAKPSPTIFKEALKRAQVRPEEALHIGDSMKDDIQGAQQVGIRAFFLDRKGTRLSTTPKISTLRFLCGKAE